MSSKLIRPLLLSIVALGSVLVGACAEEDPTFSNRAACEEFFATYNALDCTMVEIDPATSCSAYADGATVDCSNIFNCWTDSLECTDLGGVASPSYDLTNCPTACE